MKTTIQFRKSLLALIALSLVGLTVLGARTLSFSGKTTEQQTPLPQVNNRTQSFQVVSLQRKEDLDGMIVLKMKNTSKKAITAYTLVCGGGEIETDLTIGGKVIAPGGIDEIVFHQGWLTSSADDKPAMPTLTVGLVVFEDHSSEGDFNLDRRIRNKRRGIKTQLGLINTILRETSDSSRQVTLSDLSNLSSRVSSLPKDQAEAAEDFASGQHFAKETVMFLIEELKKWEADGRKNALGYGLAGATDIKSGIGKMISFNEKLISRY